MVMKTYYSKTLNRSITQCVITLHQKGYTHDFLLTGTGQFQCIQSGESFDMHDLMVSMVDCGFDLLTNTHKYIHTIDTPDGSKGLLITNNILSPAVSLRATEFFKAKNPA
jgi:hypothetical protein